MGGGYMLVAFLRSDLVVRLHWLTERQLWDAVAVGQVTPGPLFTAATFVGYLLRGAPGAVLATVGIFLPAFVRVAVRGPLVPRLRQSPWTADVLDGINVAALALMIVVSAQLARTAVVEDDCRPWNRSRDPIDPLPRELGLADPGWGRNWTPTPPCTRHSSVKPGQGAYDASTRELPASILPRAAPNGTEELCIGTKVILDIGPVRHMLRTSSSWGRKIYGTGHCSSCDPRRSIADTWRFARTIFPVALAEI